MATRDKPNKYFAWYNDDDRLAIVERQLDTTSSKGIDSGEYDSFYGSGNLSGTITNMITSGSVVTATCESHGLALNDTITIGGSRHYNGDVTVTATPTSSTFTFASSALGGTADTMEDLDVSSGTATVTTTASHGYSVGDIVYIDESTDAYDEQVTVVSTNGSDEFTYTTSKGDTTNKSGTVGDTGTFTSLFVDNGIRMTIHSKYEEVTSITTSLDVSHGLDSSMHTAVTDYVKSRLLEDMGQLEQAQFFRNRFETSVSKKRTRRSGVRLLSVPKL